MIKFKIEFRKDAVLLHNKYYYMNTNNEIVGEAFIVGISRTEVGLFYDYITLVYDEEDPVLNGVYIAGGEIPSHWILEEEFNKTI